MTPAIASHPVPHGKQLVVDTDRVPGFGALREPVGRDVELVTAAGRQRFHWYSAIHIGSAGFWVEQTRRRPAPTSYRIGRNLEQEAALCILGGHGITEDMAFAAYHAVRAEGLLDLQRPPTTEEIHAVLVSPLVVYSRPHPARYRFPRQRADRLSRALAMLAESHPPSGESGRELRDWLTRLPGVGLKTASWIVRNVLGSDDVAVVDIHIRRAGVVSGVFNADWNLPHQYRTFEQAFCAWAALGGVRTADLDATIWSQIAGLGARARAMFVPG